ncbi:cupin domain-containing protein [Rossellomorea aquimaris]|uniref:cupin domain-containing protein n=1 Tax=Rossellomorea aquimaris TaxID=189382 RepID=UPI001CD57A91|nr:cupin domain-containing protein [Rossellomorea aquimaris]MCA1056828.1 cupin domain-containing protein [Rossellomorea aquimaris]
MKAGQLKIYYLEDDGTIPNNPDLPVIIYPSEVEHTDELENIFHHNQWRNSWVNGIHEYDHYHSNTHEVLGVIEGHAHIQLGGERGVKATIQKGDVAILPAGTGHRKIACSPDFKVVGAYPDGARYDTKEGSLKDRPQVLFDIKNAPLPELDPVHGNHGPIMKYWIRNRKGISES